jgi:hypothetical protein
MAIFLVRVTRGPEAVGNQIKTLVPDDHLALATDTWLIDYPGTTRQLAEALGFLGEAAPSAGLVVAIDNYSGRANPDVWKWLKQHWSAGAHGG